MSTIQITLKGSQEHTSTVQTGAGKQGKALKIKVHRGDQYELKDLATQHAPEEILITRKGKDLLIKFKMDGQQDIDPSVPADVVLEDYYDNRDTSIGGISESGDFYSYVPEEGAPSFLASQLSEGSSSYQALGYATPGAAHNYAYLGLISLLGGLAAWALSDSNPTDTTPPIQTAPITNVVDDVAPQIGNVSSGGTTNDTFPTIKGTISSELAAGDTVVVYRDGVKVGTAMVTGTTWVFEDTGLVDGVTYTYTTRVADAAGNEGTLSAAYIIGIDTTAPTTESTIDSYVDDVGSITNTASTAATTDDNSITLTGSVTNIDTAAGETVNVYRDGVLMVGTLTVGTASALGVSSWTFTPVDTTVGTGSHTYTSAVADAAGNTLASTGSLAITYDNAPPSVVVKIETYTDNVGGSQGDFASGTTTDDRTPVLNGTYTGTLATTDVIRIYEGSVYLGNATRSGSNWTYALPTLSDSTTHTYHAVPADAAGNENVAGQSSNFVINVSLNLTVNPQTTLDTTPIVSGIIGFPLDTGEHLQVTINGVTYDSSNSAVVIDPTNYTWYVQIPTALAIGTYEVAAVVLDAASANVTTDHTNNELTIAVTPVVTVGAAATDPNQKGTAYTIGEDGMWRIHTNQSMLDANGTSSSTLGDFSKTTLVSNTLAQGYDGPNYVQNATFMDYNRDGYMDLFAEDSTFNDGQQAFTYSGANTYTALQVGGPASLGGDRSQTPGSANAYTWYGGVVAFDKTGDGYADLSYGDQTPYDENTWGGFDSGIVLNVDGTILGMVKDGGYVDTATTGSTNDGNMTSDMELSGVDLNNDGKIDLISHQTTGATKLGGAGASTPTSSNQNRLVVATNNGDGSWTNTQIVDNVFQRNDDDPYTGNAVSMTWADFNGDGFMDLFMGRGNENTTTASGANNNAAEYASRIYFNDGAGHLLSTATTGIGNATGLYTFSDNIAGGASFGVDWNGDGKMDVIELPGMGVTGGVDQAHNTGAINLYTNTTASSTVSFTTTNLLGGSNTIGLWTGNVVTNNAVTGAISIDLDWDGDRDLLAFTQLGNTRYVENTSTIAAGTSLHLRIVDANSINSLYGNTVQLFNSSGVLVSTQIINPQSGSETNDSSALVDFYGLSATETYSAVVLRSVGAVSSDVGGLASLGGNTVENVNAAWTGLVAGAANHAFVLTAESDTSNASTTGAVGIVGTGYNDTFFASLGTDVYNGAGGTETFSGVTAWSNTGGQDIIDFKLAGSTAVNVDLSLTTSQNTGWDNVTLKNIEGAAGASGNDVFTDSAANNYLEGRGGNDTFNLTNGGGDTLIYNALSADAMGGNGVDTVHSFFIGTYEATANADRIDLSKLLIGYATDANGPAHYINGVATIDSGETIGNYLSLQNISGNSADLFVDRDGAGGAYVSTLLMTIDFGNVSPTTDTLTMMLANHQFVL